MVRAAHADADARYQHHLEQRKDAAEEARYLDKTPGELLAMWKTGRNPHGNALSDSEFRSLCAAWYVTFGTLPPEDGTYGSVGLCAGKAEQSKPTSPRALAIPDGPLSRHEVCELTGISIATLDRMVKDGRFPQPYRVSERRLMFQGFEVREWSQRTEAARKRA